MAITQKLDELEKEKKSGAGTVSGGGALPVTGYKTQTPSGNAQASAENPRITALRQYLEKTVGGTPTESDLLKSVREQLMNRPAFSYDPNTDPSAQQYLEEAKRSGKMAMEDTMGKASSLTGGYGNSYAATAGQNAYNQYMQEANQMIPEYEELARARYDAETAALGDKYALLQSEHEAELEDYWNRYGIAREDWYNEQERLDSERQYEDEKKQREIELLLAMGDYSSLDRMGYNTSALRQQAAASLYSGSSGSSSSSSSSSSGSDDSDDYEGDGLYSFAREETRKTANGKGYESSGNMVFTDPNGKEIVLAKGINPYTRSTNTDIKYGTFKNGYQPNHIVFNKGTKDEYAVKLVDTGDDYPVEGRYQNIWMTESGGKVKYWLWDGRSNRYIDITADYNNA